MAYQYSTLLNHLVEQMDFIFEDIVSTQEQSIYDREYLHYKLALFNNIINYISKSINQPLPF